MTAFQTDLKRLMQTLSERGYHPSRTLGQNFLTDPNLLKAVVREGELAPDDVVLEVGTGSGWLTRLLAAEARQVIGVEIDDRLFEHCEQTLADLDNVTLIHGDVLETKNRLNAQVVAALEPFAGRFKVVANLPFQISSPLLVLLYESGLHPARAVVTLQAEMARRLAAEPGTKLYGPVSATLGYFAQTRVVRKIRARMFWPPPQVDAAVVRIDTQTEAAPCDYAAFRRTTRAIFAHRRKRLQGALRNGLGLSAQAAEQAIAAADLSPDIRPDRLSVEQIGRLAQALTTPSEVD